MTVFSTLKFLNLCIYYVSSFKARGDFIFAEDSAVLLIKWSKTVQDRKQSVFTIPLPNLGASQLCPIRAITNMTQLFPAAPNGPLFVTPRNFTIVPLTDSVAGKHLKKISDCWSIPTSLTFHAFRRVWCHVEFPTRCVSGAHCKTWYLEIRCGVVLPFLNPFHYLSCLPCFSTVLTSLALLGVWVNS